MADEEKVKTFALLIERQRQAPKGFVQVKY